MKREGLKWVLSYILGLVAFGLTFLLTYCLTSIIEDYWLVVPVPKIKILALYGGLCSVPLAIFIKSFMD